jgi:hypothetical protein
MRPQARPFSVEIRSRKRPLRPAIAASANTQDWIDAEPPDDLPERDIHADAAEGDVLSEARLEAERAFQRLSKGEPLPENTHREPELTQPSEPAATVRRILPSLLASREEEREVDQEPKRTRTAASDEQAQEEETTNLGAGCA